MQRALLVLGLLVSSAGTAQDFSAARIATVPVTEGIYMLTGPGGNIGVSVGQDGVFIIDDQFAPMFDKINAAISEISEKPVGMVFNTHWHNDHTGGNEAFGEAGVLIVAHDNVRAAMSVAQVIELFNSQTPPSPAAALPVVTFDSTVTLHLNGHTIHAQHVPPAHTNGDSIVWFREANVVHMGDTYFNGMYPFIDFARGGSIAGMIGAIDLALEGVDAQTKIIPGHGPLSNRDEMLAYRSMLATIADSIQTRLDRGESVEAIVAAKPTAEFDADWAGGFIQPDDWVGMIAGGLAQ